MRRLLTLLAALSLALVLPASASAARATRITAHTVNLYCDGIHPTAGSGFAFFGAAVSDVDGPDAYFDVWTGDEPIGDPDLHRDFEQPPTVTWDGTTLSGSMSMVDATGAPSGTATFSATLAPLGDPEPFTDSFKDGNTKYQDSGTNQPMQPTGSAILTSTGQTFDLGICFADTTTVSIFATNPNSFVTHFAQRTTDCELTDGAGNTGFLFVDFTEGDAFIDSAVFPGGGSAGIGATGGGQLVGDTLDAALDTYVRDTGDAAGVPASIHMIVTATGEPFDRLLRSRDRRIVSRGTLLDIEGTLTIGAYVFDLGACIGGDYQTKIINTSPKGPKPGGKAPANDLPSGAKALAVGGSAVAQTKGAAPDREAAFDCLVFEDETGASVEVPVTNTVWYKFTGTGKAVTIDTAGSDFDTVLATYTAGPGGSFTPVPGGCADDVPTPPVLRTLQAAATISTVVGTTYYVQIGGFPDTSFPYGNLRVSLR